MRPGFDGRAYRREQWVAHLTQMETNVYTITEFCLSNRISRSLLYTAWKEGTGPRVFRVGTKVLITREAAAEWRAERERATSQHSGATHPDADDAHSQVA